MKMRACNSALVIVALATATAPLTAQPPPGAVDARMLRYPDVSATDIAFVYAGDIWIVPKTGGTATRLSSPRGEEQFPRFSPDGTRLAYSANYDGNVDLYVVPARGGLPLRLTYHGASDRMVDWYPDGQRLLFASTRTSFRDRFNQLWSISAEGGLPERLPVPYGEFGAISPDGRTLAYTPISVDFRTWKRYRGGMNADIWLLDLQTRTARNLTRHEANDSQPMWHGTTLYFLSDRDAHKRHNIWACDTRKGTFRQVTFFKDYDVTFPSIGPQDIVFENGGRLYLLDLQTEQYREVHITVVTDRATLKPRQQNVSSHLQGYDISPSGKRAVFAARGRLFTVPAEHGVVRSLGNDVGAADRYPAWSPDGQWIACFSDRTGEYELTLRPANEPGPAQTLTALGPGYRYRPWWSPDSRKLAFIDQAMRLHLYDLDARTNRVIDRQLWMYHGELSRFRPSWSADSRWLAYARDCTNNHTAIVLYDTRTGQAHQVTSGFYNDAQPVFDPDGKYLFFLTGRSFTPVYSDLDNTWIYPNTVQIAAVPLRKDVPSPLAPRNDEEGEKKEKADEKKTAEEKKEKAEEKKAADKKADKPQPEPKPTPVEIDLEDFERRVVLLPPKPGRYDDLWAASGKVIYRRLPRAGSADEKSPVMFYDLEKREEKTILDDADDALLSAKRDKLLVRKRTDYAIIEVKEGQKMDKKLATGSLETVIDPVAEWRQIFTDAWRLQRDYFYDPGLHGVDWEAMRQRYSRLLADCVTRWDVNAVIGDLIAELNASHTYRSGGDLEQAESRGVGYLGCDFVLEQGAYRIAKIIDGAPWDAEVRSPLRQPGVQVQEGDFLLAVNGVPVDPGLEPAAAFQGLADKPVLLTVNSKPTRDGAREVLVQTLASEARLRQLAWIEANRQRVDQASGGQIGYVYVPDTGRHGQSELVRQFRAQFHKPGLIIDERFNSGGQIPDRFVELIGRRLLNYWGVRDGLDWPWPRTAHRGPMVMLINGWSGSGGDCFPYYFKKAGLGLLIGQRTWGGLIGMTGTPPLIDGGSVTVPTFGIYDTDGRWIIEGFGVSPDIEVVDDPGLMAQGQDPQLDRAVAEILKQLEANPPKTVPKPQYPIRAAE